MRKKITLFKKYKSIAVIGLLILSGNVSMAQVSYLDLNPDVTKSENDLYNVDLDGDGTADFIIFIDKSTDEPLEDKPATTFTGYTSSIAGTTANNQIVIPDAEDINASALNAGDVVDNSLSYTDEALIFITGTYKTGETTVPGSYGNFLNSVGKYLGVKFVSGGNTYYGYIGINTTGISFTVRDYAYEKTKDVAITVGATTTSVSDYINSNTTIRNINNTIIADFANQFTGEIDVVNLNGQLVKSVEVNGLSSSINMEGTPSGIYQVVISGKEGMATKKVFISAK